ncbi:hypothetical protein ATANTOWER_022068 [Ataeniobius toweri]|uniref:Uncharacterized protein n=1 Tax=Ataeniobius toweri TaxID=208326 RepID=A0ABU7C0G3_9TELE|nr:hypothetical protein [Ataeniobius toweri]
MCVETKTFCTYNNNKPWFTSAFSHGDAPAVWNGLKNLAVYRSPSPTLNRILVWQINRMASTAGMKAAVHTSTQHTQFRHKYTPFRHKFLPYTNHPHLCLPLTLCGSQRKM